jgi:hypothetical protein
MSNLIIKKDSPKSLQSSLSKMIEAKSQLRRTDEQCVLLLCDVSGSMDDTVKGRRKIETLAETVNKLTKKRACRIIAFSSQARLVKELRADAGGGTNLTAALQLAASQKAVTKAIVISDGFPDNPSMALNAAKGMTCPISCIYIGPGDDDGYRFLCELARLGKGQASYTGDDTNLIEQKINLLLTA